MTSLKNISGLRDFKGNDGEYKYVEGSSTPTMHVFARGASKPASTSNRCALSKKRKSKDNSSEKNSALRSKKIDDSGDEDGKEEEEITADREGASAGGNGGASRKSTRLNRPRKKVKRE
tara:strand:- start:393 stop:749 length:357 start_codon:yes stop_codon:yes gene_type:complete